MRQKDKRRARRAAEQARTERAAQEASAIAYDTPYGILCQQCASAAGPIPADFRPRLSFPGTYSTTGNPSPIKCCNCDNIVAWAPPEDC